MVNRIETNTDSIVLQKKKEELAAFDAMDLLRSEKDPSLKFKKGFVDDVLSFDPITLEKKDIAYKKDLDSDTILKKKLAAGMDDDDIILQKKLDEGFDNDDIILKKKLTENFDEKKPSNLFENVMDVATLAMHPAARVARAIEVVYRQAMAEQYAQLKKSKEFDEG